MYLFLLLSCNVIIHSVYLTDCKLPCTPISYWSLLPNQKSRLAKPMGNAESSSTGGGGGGDGEKDTESGFEKALKVAAPAAAAGAVGYGTYKLMSHSEAEEEVERPARVPGKDKCVGWSSASRSIREGKSGNSIVLNTDFSGPSGMGMLIRGSDGVMLWCLAERVESCVIKNNRGEIIYRYPSQLDGGLRIDQGEALALLKGLEVARDKGYRNLVALTDHESNVQSINSTNNKKKSDIIQQIRDAKCNWFLQCEIKYVRREDNRCANHLAYVAATRGPSSFEELKNSRDLNRILQDDKDNLF